MSERAPRSVERTVDNAVFYSDGTVLIKNVRASFPFVTRPRQGTLDKKTGKVSNPSFQCVGVLPKSTHSAAILGLQAMIKARFLVPHNKGADIKPASKFLRKGAEEGKPEYAEAWIVSAREQETHPPRVRKPNKEPLAHGEKVMSKTGKAISLEGGCYINMLVRPWWQNSVDYGKRVNCGLVAVQLLNTDYEPYSENSISDEAIDETFEDESGGDDLSWADEDDAVGL